MFLKFKKTKFNVSIASEDSEHEKMEDLGYFENIEEIGEELFEKSGIDFDDNPTLIGAVLDLAVIDEFNYNHEGVRFDVAKKFAKRFAHQPADLEHKLKKIIGHAVMGVITEEVEKDGKKYRRVVGEDESQPEGRCYITVVVVFYAIPDEDVTKMLLESTDKLKASWEILTTQYQVWAEKSSSVLSIRVPYKYCEKISINEEIEACLKTNGGNGRLPDGRRVFKDIIEFVAPFGLAITTRPAANVGPIKIISSSVSFDDENSEEVRFEADALNKSAASEKNLSLIMQKCVKDSSNMKLFLEKLKASFASSGVSVDEVVVKSIDELFNSSLKEANAEFIKERDEALNRAKEFEEKVSTFSKAVSEQNAAIELLQARVKESDEKLSLIAQKEEGEKLAKIYEGRLGLIKETFAFDDREMSIVAKQVGKLETDEASFASYLEDAKVIYSAKTKSAVESEKLKKEASAMTPEAIKDKISKGEISLASILPEGTTIPNIADRKDENQKLTEKFARALDGAISIK